MRVVLISRFNVYIKHFREMAGVTDDDFAAWCAKRVELFERFTLSSVLNQSFPHWRWVIGFDTVITDEVAGLLERLKKEPRIVPIVSNNRPGAGPGFLADMAAKVIEISGTDENILTCRLDTDDLIHRDYLSTIHTAGRSAEINDAVPAALDFPYGAQMHNGKLYAFVYMNNPFLGVIERPDRMKTAFGLSHYDAPKVFPVRSTATAQPMWLQVIHGGNAANQFKTELQELNASDDLMSAFGLLRGNSDGDQSDDVILNSDGRLLSLGSYREAGGTYADDDSLTP